ncbi:MAG TPA: hypothetical protein VIV12_25720 [Streptosporangiaceae bacterium]
MGTLRRECLDNVLVLGEQHRGKVRPSTRGATTVTGRTKGCSKDLRSANPATPPVSPRESSADVLWAA